MPPRKRPAASPVRGAVDAKKSKKQTKTVVTPSPKSSAKARKGKKAADVPQGAAPSSAGSSAGGSSWLGNLIDDQEWKNQLADELEQDYFKDMEKKLLQEYNANTVFPPKEQIFNAFHLTPLAKVKIVILGQDPYHDDGQAHGLSFSVPKGVKVPPSLRNMYKELAGDIKGFKAPPHGCLEKWAKEGVLLLNATLTVEAHTPNSHAKFGWQRFTDHVIKVLSSAGKPMVFILWGNFAHKKEKLIDCKKHVVVKSAHPSPLSFNKFFGCKCFSQANASLHKLGRGPVDWSLD